jgi:iron complex transport system substrate-binding protein
MKWLVMRRLVMRRLVMRRLGHRLFGLLAIAVLAQPAAAAPAPRVATMDWTVATTLLALGVTPEGVAEIGPYRAWVRVPHMPSRVNEIGLRAQPNLELLDQMAPDRIFISRQFASLEPVLSRIAPTVLIRNDDGKTKWQAMLAQTRQIARVVDRGEAAEALIRRTRRTLERYRAGLQPQTRPLLVMQFMNATHVRVFGDNSVYGSVLRRLGLENAWTRATNSWGFSLVSLAQLKEIDARLVVVKPIPVGAEPGDDAVWRTLPSVRRGDVVRLGPAWSFGALPAVQQFARELADAL